MLPFKTVSDPPRDNKGIVAAAVRQHGNALQHARALVTGSVSRACGPGPRICAPRAPVFMASRAGPVRASPVHHGFCHSGRPRYVRAPPARTPCKFRKEGARVRRASWRPARRDDPPRLNKTSGRTRPRGTVGPAQSRLAGGDHPAGLGARQTPVQVRPNGTWHLAVSATGLAPHRRRFRSLPPACLRTPSIPSLLHRQPDPRPPAGLHRQQLRLSDRIGAVFAHVRLFA